jgi:hypothetical protein
LENGETVAFGDYGYFKKDDEGDVAFENADVTSIPTTNLEPPKSESDGIKDNVTTEPEPEETKDSKEEPEAKEDKEERDPKTEATSTTSTVDSTLSETTTQETTNDSNPKESKSDVSAIVDTTPLQTEPSNDTDSEQTKKNTEDRTKTSETDNENNSLRPKKEHNIAEKEEIAANRQKLENLKTQKEIPAKRRKRSAGFWILMVLIVVLLGGGTYVGIYYDDVKSHIPFLAEDKAVESDSDAEIAKMKEMVGEEPITSEEKPEESSETIPAEPTEPEQEEDMVSTTENEPSEKVTETQPKPTPVVNTNNNQPYHIVAGVFSNASNAERLASNIREMGYPAKTFLRGNQTVVSVQSYASSTEAQAALSTTKDAAPKGWILKWDN